MNNQRTMAYFFMEMALEPDMPTYSGGLGMLAGNTIRFATDLKVPMVAVTLLYRKGYFVQKLDASGWQTETSVDWDVSRFCRELSPRVQVNIEGRSVHLRAWQHTVKGISGHEVPVFLLDTDLPGNSEWDRRLTDHCTVEIHGIGFAKKSSSASAGCGWCAPGATKRSAGFT